MSEVLACEAWDVFKAAVSIAGVVEYEPGGNDGLKVCDQRFNASGKSTPLLAVHGTLDVVVPWYGDPLFGYVCIDQETFLGQNCNMHEWLARSQCGLNYTTVYSKGAYDAKRFTNCSHPRATFELVRKTDGGHEWPVDSDFNTTAYAAAWLLDGPGSGGRA